MPPEDVTTTPPDADASSGNASSADEQEALVPAPTDQDLASESERGATFPPSTDARAVPDDASLDHPHLYFNRELSTIDFNWRVLYQGLDERTPLLERVFFTAITAANLDEFFRKRVGGLKRQEAAGVSGLTPDGRTPDEQLALIRPAVTRLYDRMTAFWKDTLVPALREEVGVHIRDYGDLSDDQRAYVDEHFQKNIFPVLTPLAVDPGHPFPFLSNLSLSLAVTLRNPSRDTEHFARIKVPANRDRWVQIKDSHHFVPLEQVIAHNLDELFRGMEIRTVHAFRVTRNADIRRDEEEADDLLEMISEELRERRFARIVRLEIDADMPDHVRQLLMDELDINEDDIYATDSALGLDDCMELAGLDFPDHKYAPWEPVVPPRLQHEGDPADLVRRGKTANHPDIFSVIQEGDILAHHPYDSFKGTVQQFVEEAADDPNVIAIKQTLYRTAEDSPIVAALVRAAEQGKQVAVLVEVKARFDEANNIEWGRTLEESGVHVAYGLVGLKTHAKATLVIRQEEDGPRTYCHLGTGNYNSETARQYTDMGIITCDPDIGYDVTNLFHYLTGYAPEQHYRELLVAPQNMRRRFYDLVHREIEHQKNHGTGRIIAKMNALEDRGMVKELYKASRAGVTINLIIRGHSRLRPGLDGYSENVQVISTLGRFLEHTRVYHFHNNGDPEVYLGSADWMSRNLEDRVEAIMPVKNERLRERIIHVLETALADQRSAWDLHADGRYVQRVPADDEHTEGLQEALMRRTRERALQDQQPE